MPIGLKGIILLTAAALAPACLQAQSLTLPDGATIASEKIDNLASYMLPTGPWDGRAVATLPTEGARKMQAWQMPADGRTTLEILAPLRDQLVADGFDILFECEAATCGGFDFRYATEVLPEPAMHVDLGDYRYLAAQRKGKNPDYVSLLVSRTSTRGFVHVIRVGAANKALARLTLSTKTPVSADPAPAGDATAPLISQLEQTGSVVLADLHFETGAARLDDSGFDSLTTLSDYLKANPDRRIALVGHTDAEGTLEGNIALSRARAQAVAERLIQSLDIPESQISAVQGVGFLSPIANNDTETGRTRNRRVEVVLITD